MAEMFRSAVIGRWRPEAGSLGVLDALFLSQPGVLEARQRITMRMRAARSAEAGQVPPTVAA